MFEGLFVRALAVDPASRFADDLRAAGCDLRRLEAHYDIAVWVACVDLAARYVYPELSRDEAWIRLGRRFIEGYLHTFVGGAIAAALPFMDPKRFVERIPHFLRTGLGGSSADVDLTSETTAVLWMHGPHPRSPLLLTGVLEVCFERLGVSGTCQATVIEGDESKLEISWTPRS